MNNTDVDADCGTGDIMKCGWLNVEGVAVVVFVILLILFGSLFYKARQSSKANGGRV